MLPKVFHKRTPEISNQPFWGETKLAAQDGFYEIWHLHLIEPATQKSLVLTFQILKSKNDFKKVSEVTFTQTQRTDGDNIQTSTLKKSKNIDEFSKEENLIKIGDCEFGDHTSQGHFQSKGKEVKWELRFRTDPSFTPSSSNKSMSFDSIPPSFLQTNLFGSKIWNTNEIIRVEGFTEVDGERTEWREAFGTQRHLSGVRKTSTWYWAHCNTFFNQSDEPANFIFEGFSYPLQSKIKFLSPWFSSFFFLYQGKEYSFNSLRNFIRIKSKPSLSEWFFRADVGDLSFEGKIQGKLKSFSGMTEEDTDGTYLYRAESSFADMNILVYRKGKLENRFSSKSTTFLEHVAREKNPYVQLSN